MQAELIAASWVDNNAHLNYPRKMLLRLERLNGNYLREQKVSFCPYHFYLL